MHNADYSGLYTQFMKDNIETLLPVIKEIILNPSFPEDEIEKRKQRWIAELRSGKRKSTFSNWQLFQQTYFW
ncbi:MAG: hypothetical protein MZV64_56265 [Ignavibacteriales bacterium]|nr:hypothetical protein [Ignavibacteriales bacterium]